MKTIRDYLQEISTARIGADWLTTNVLNECEEAAKKGLTYLKTTVHKDHSESVIEYLVSVARLTVDAAQVGCLTVLHISWGDEN